jgi:hypothetical protein
MGCLTCTSILAFGDGTASREAHCISLYLVSRIGYLITWRRTRLNLKWYVEKSVQAVKGRVYSLYPKEGRLRPKLASRDRADMPYRGISSAMHSSWRGRVIR